MSLSLHQFLLLYLWFPLVAFLIFLLLIARFYEKFSGERTFYQLLVIPMVLFGVACVRYASIGSMVGDTLADVMLGISGAVLLLITGWLYWLMIGRKTGDV